MKIKNRQKICYNCNAQVDLDVIVCPYCGTDLLEEFESEYKIADEDIDNKVLSPQQTVASLYPPPYQAYDNNEEDETSDEVDEVVDSIEKQYSPSPVPVIALAFSMNVIGIVFLLFFFSGKGEINLRINIKYLILMLIAVVPIFFWSWKTLKEE